MKKILILFLLPFYLFGQSKLINLYRNSNEPAKVSFNIENNISVSARDFFTTYSESFGLNPINSLKEVSLNVEKNGLKHYKYKQYYNQLEIYGAHYILHEYNKKVVNGNGIIYPYQDINLIPKINSSEAITICEKTLNCKSSDIEVHSNDLVLINRNYPYSDGELVLAYVIEIHQDNPIHDSRKLIIDAITKQVILNFSTLKNCFMEKGKVQTRYHRDHDMDADKDGSEFITRDNTRGGGILVTNKKGLVYSDADNEWNKGTKDYDNGVHDLFWGLQSTYDYYKNKLNRDGADNKKLPIRALLLDEEVYVNAFWSPTLYTLNFGIGDNVNYSALTSLDVVSHEFTHGVTQFSAGLEYLYEAGAMNEAFSDILGKAVEYEYDRDSFNWYIGARFAKLKSQAFRNMENPNPYQCPKYYKGIQWKTGSGDNGGVHSNSGVLNYWFYLLCTGKDTVNEVKVRFNVKKMTFDSAALFAYTLLNNYLGPTSTYYDAREASLLLAANWWGSCSPNYLNIVEAWKAVGVGTSAIDNDIQLVNTNSFTSACKDGFYTINSRINNLGCTSSIPSGTEIILFYKLDTFPIYQETLTLATSITGANHIDFNFKVNPKIVKGGTSRLTVWMESGIDSDTSNNRYILNINKIGNSTDFDFRLVNFNVVGAPCPVVGNTYFATGFLSYLGCSVLPAKTELDLFFEFKDSSFTYKYITPTSIYPQGFINLMGIPIPRSFLGAKRYKLSIRYPKDTVFTNNSINSQMVFINNRILNELETFANVKYDSAKLAVSTDSFNTAIILNNTEFSSEAIHITGGRILNPNGSLIPRNQQDQNSMFTSNSKFTTRMYICADLASLTSPKFEFDIAQKLGSFNYDSLNWNFPRSPASTRVTFFNPAGEILYQEFIFEAAKDIVKEHHVIDIPAKTTYIEMYNLCLSGGVSANGDIDPNGDLIIIDNVVITGATNVDDIDNRGSRIEIFPNPSKGEITIINKEFNDQISSIKIYNLMGQEAKFSRMGTNKLNLEESGTFELLITTKNGLIFSKRVCIIE